MLRTCQIAVVAFATVLMCSQNAAAADQGTILREYWANIPGTNVSALTTSSVYPATPTARDYLPRFEAPTNWADNYGTRVRGFIHPTMSGTYYFWIAGDDNCELWLSPNQDPLQKNLIATVPGWTSQREWIKYSGQKSAAVTLVAGAVYYIEALQKEGGGLDNLAVAWTGPGIGEVPTVIDGTFLSPAPETNPVVPVGVGTGVAIREKWIAIPGNTLSQLTSNDTFPHRPTSRQFITELQGPTNDADNYGSRLRGYLCPAITGTYHLWLASDDNGELHLSSDEDPTHATLIASVPTYTTPLNWYQFPQQASAPIQLLGGQRYYFEVLHKDGTGGDHAAVAWSGPSLAQSIVTGTYLAPIRLILIDGERSFATETTVTLTSTVAGGAIHFTMDGTTPTAASPVYSGPLSLSVSTVIKAVHVTAAGVASEVTEQAFVKQGTGSGLTASYFANEQLSGPALRQLDSTLNFNWGGGVPRSGIASDHFSVRWQGEIETNFNTNYQLIIRSDDGVRVWIDGILVMNDWSYHAAKDNNCTLTPGRHGIEIEYKEGTGQASLQLLWQNEFEARHVVPVTQLYPLLGVAASIPTSSAVSPVYIETTKTSGNTLTACVNGIVVSTAPLDETIDYFNVPLQVETPTAIAIQAQSGESVQGEVTWASTIIHNELELVIRKNDSLLFESPTDGTILITNYSGTYLTPFPVTTGQLVPIQFTKSGEFTATQLDAQGNEIGVAYVTVVSADLSQQIICEVGYERIINFPISPNDPPITFTGNKQLTIGSVVIASGNAQVPLTPTQRGTPRILARILGPHGPLVAERMIDEFTLNNAALNKAFVHTHTRIGTTQLIMRPYIPNEIFVMQMFAHASTFRGGATSITVNSTGGSSSNGEAPMQQVFDSVTQEIIGVFNFDLEVPSGENKYCYRLLRRQAAQEIEGTAYLKGTSSIYGLQANIERFSVLLHLGYSVSEGPNGPTTNINGDTSDLLVDLDIHHGQFGDLVSDAEEEIVGAFTVANKNDTDGDSRIDNGDDNVTATANGRDEVDLMKLILRKPEPDLGGFVTLSIESGNVKLWEQSNKVTPVTTMIFETTELEKILWVEAIETSTSIRDIELKLTYNGVEDKVKATGVWAEKTIFFNSGSTISVTPPTVSAGLKTLIMDTSFLYGATHVSPKTNNVMLLEFMVKPPGIGNEPLVIFDITRRRESIGWDLRSDVWLAAGGNIPATWPMKVEDVNDDAGTGDEDNIPDNDLIYSMDAPGFTNDAGFSQRSIRRHNFYEFVRVKIGSNFVNAQGSAEGSRSSQYVPWYSRMDVVSDGLGRLWMRNGLDNEIEEGHKILGIHP